MTQIINALVWFIVGMVSMARIYCVQLGITEGPMFIGWDTFGITIGAVVGMRLLAYVDPSFD